jgi:hypothetical protein
MVMRASATPPLGPLGSVTPLGQRRRDERRKGGKPDPRALGPSGADPPAEVPPPCAERSDGVPSAGQDAAEETAGKRHIDVRV